jgi:hypothetical protein
MQYPMKNQSHPSITHLPDVPVIFSILETASGNPIESIRLGKESRVSFLFLRCRDCKLCGWVAEGQVLAVPPTPPRHLFSNLVMRSSSLSRKATQELILMTVSSSLLWAAQVTWVEKYVVLPPEWLGGFPGNDEWGKTSWTDGLVERPQGKLPGDH